MKNLVQKRIVCGCGSKKKERNITSLQIEHTHIVIMIARDEAEQQSPVLGGPVEGLWIYKQ